MFKNVMLRKENSSVVQNKIEKRNNPKFKGQVLLQDTMHLKV